MPKASLKSISLLRRAAPPGTAQTSATNLGVTTDANMPSMGGRFASVYPLYDGTNRMLVSWSPCLVLDTTVTPNATNLCTRVEYFRHQRDAGAAAVHACGSMTWTRAPWDPC